MKEIRVSKHARERYAERVKEKNDKLDMARYVITHCGRENPRFQP